MSFVRPRRWVTRLVLVCAGPVVWLAFWTAANVVERRGATDDPAAVVATIQGAFAAWLEDAHAFTRHALDTSPWTAASALPAGPLAPRLEGVGQTDGATYIDWRGRPIPPRPELVDPAAPRWSIRRDGLHTRLVVRAGPNGLGLSALATFVLDAPYEGQTFVELLDPELRRRNHIEVAFGGTGAQGGWRLDAPDGTPLASVDVAPLSTRIAAKRVTRLGRAVTLLVLLGSLAGAFRWSAWCRTRGGFVTALAAIVAGRGLLLWDRVPERLLPRAIAAPELYGAAIPRGLLGSPADLLLTCLAIYLAAAALRRRMKAASVAAARLWSSAAAAGAIWAVLSISRSLAVDASIPVLALDNLARLRGPAWLVVGWVLALLAAAELAAAAWSAWTRRPFSRRFAAVALLPVALVASASFLIRDDAERIERLRAEYRPLVLQQDAHRSVALETALRQCAETIAGSGDLVLSGAMAFRLWLESDLFYGGYQSSIELLSSIGAPLARFGFGLPALADQPLEELEALGDEEPRISHVERLVGALPTRLLHGTIAVVRGGETIGYVVAHVVDEPWNLPFLPGNSPYLEALAVDAGRGDLPQPEYVLYDRRGTVLLSTLDEPPSLTRELEIAATRDRTVRLPVGEDNYTALPLLDGDRLHLLLMRTRTWLDRAAGFVRLALPALGLLLATGLSASMAAGVGPARLIHAVRASFHRKLLVTMMVASVVPLVGLALFVRGYIERRGEASEITAAVQGVSVAQRVVEDFLLNELQSGRPPEIDGDDILHWLRRLVERDIHVYRDGRLEASSRRELFDSGLLPVMLPGIVQEQLEKRGLPYQVLDTPFGSAEIAVAYAPLRAADLPRGLVVAVPMVAAGDEIERGVERVAELLLLATAVLIGVLSIAAAALARSVARPVRELVDATARIAGGDYSTRLTPATEDEIAGLVNGFNAMASALATQRADLERRRDYVEALLRNATTGVGSTDPDGRLVTVNPALNRVLGLDDDALGPGDALGPALARDEDLAELAILLGSFDRIAGEPREIDIERDGVPRRLRVVRVPLPDPFGGRPGALILVDDVTDIMRSNQLAAWAEMARAIAHEIKNPLTPIQLSTQHLERLLGDRGVLPSGDVRSCLETVKNQVQALREIAAEFSTYARLPTLTPETCDPVDLLREIAAPYRSASEQGVELREEYAATAPIEADRKVLGRALVNLIENALQAMPDGGTLTLAVEPRDGGRGVRLRVDDTGSGLGSEVRARLFEPYFSTKSSGTGLGLAIVRQAVEAHRGTVHVRSRAGRGTSFRIDLPAAAAGAVAMTCEVPSTS